MGATAEWQVAGPTNIQAANRVYAFWRAEALPLTPPSQRTGTPSVCWLPVVAGAAQQVRAAAKGGQHQQMEHGQGLLVKECGLVQAQMSATCTACCATCTMACP